MSEKIKKEPDRTDRTIREPDRTATEPGRMAQKEEAFPGKESAAAAAADQRKASLWSWKFILLILMSLMNGVAGMMTVPLVAKYALALGAELTLASTVAGLMSLVSLVVCPFAGALADKVSRKWILVFANLGYGICLCLHAVCTNIPLLIVMRLLTGIFFSVCSVTNVAFSASFIPKERTGEGLGYISLAAIVAQAVGPGIGIAIAAGSDYARTFLVAGLFPFVCIATILPLKYVREKMPAAPSKKHSLKNLYAADLTCFMLMAALFSAGNGMVSTYLTIIAEEREIANISLFFTVYSLFLIAIRPFTGRLLDRKGVFVILVPSFLFAALGMVFVGVGGSLGVLLAAAVFKALGQGNGQPSIQAYSVKKLSRDRSGVASSTVLIGQNVGNAVAPIVGSFFVKSFGYTAMFCGFGVFMAAAGLVLIFIQSRTDKRIIEKR